MNRSRSNLESSRRNSSRRRLGRRRLKHDFDEAGSGRSFTPPRNRTDSSLPAFANGNKVNSTSRMSSASGEDIPSFSWNGEKMTTSRAERERSVDEILYGEGDDNGQTTREPYLVALRRKSRSGVRSERGMNGSRHSDEIPVLSPNTESTRSPVVSPPALSLAPTDSSLSFGNTTERSKQKHSSRRKKVAKKQLDEFGFIVNIDDRGNLRNCDVRREKNSQTPEEESKLSRRDSSPGSARKTRSRERKWSIMLNNWEMTKARRKKKLRRRLRKGVPNAVRGMAWAQLGDVPNKIDFEKKGEYGKLVAQAESEETMAEEADNSGNSTRETIDRDINRTFPRHSMFFEDRSSQSLSDQDYPDEDDSGDSSADNDTNSLPSSDGGHHSSPDKATTSQIENVLDVMQCGPTMGKCVVGAGGKKSNSQVAEDEKLLTSGKEETMAPTNKAASTRQTQPEDFVVQMPVGHAALRRVLRAYSMYDREVGYCQGMNFIAAMFITFMTEEEAFWLLVSVMNEPPCKMRGLFGDRMTEAHQVLYVAEKLIHRFLPELSAHLERESVHVTMFATQWLLTLYTSSFPFGLVTRVWDIFLAEGWKIVYRVMLALLDRASPDLMKLKFEGILGYFRELPKEVDGPATLETAFKIPLRTKFVELYETEWRATQVDNGGSPGRRK